MTVFLRRRCSGSVEVEDAVQETFLQAWRIWDRADDVRNLRNWLIGIARRVVGHMLRAASIRPQGDREVDEDDRVEAPQQEIALYVEQLRRHFQGLGPLQRDAMDALSRGWTLTEVADATGKTQANVGAAISLARKRLRQRLGVDVGQFSPVG